MFSDVGRRGRVGALTGVCAAAVLAAVAASAAAAAQPQAHPRTQAPTQATLAGVPWARVGAGWTLAQYAGGAQSTHATTLYLISPGGTKYTMYTWRASMINPPGLIAWSGDKTRALLYGQGPGQVAQLNLTTRKLSRFTLAGRASAIGYTVPDGLNILGVRESGGQWTLASNAGRVIRQLPVPGTNPSNGCIPVRWWDTRTVLADCVAKSYDLERLWLVPADGARPTALTPVRKPATHDLGDLDAWRLTSGLYLQSAGACGALDISKQAANGSITQVTVPGAPRTQAVPYNNAENAPRL